MAMEWRDLSYEVVGKEGVMVVGLLDWAISAENKVTFSYTALLTYQEGGLKLRLEDESRRVPPPAPVKADAGVAK